MSFTKRFAPVALFMFCFTGGSLMSPLFAQPTSRAGAATAVADYETALTALLQQVVTADGLVRYDLLRGELNADFRAVLKAIEEFDATALQTDAQKLAFWMNAYNVQMLQNIVATPHVKDIIADGFGDTFFKTPYRTAQNAASLDQIEHVILRRQEGPAALTAFQVTRLDPRIHVGLNCAAVSCPRLRQRAFTASTVNEELDAAMRDFTTSPAHFRVEGDAVIASSLLDWFASDFDGTGVPAGDFLLQHMPTDRPDYRTFHTLLSGKSASEIKAQPDVQFEYLWQVNAATD